VLHLPETGARGKPAPHVLTGDFDLLPSQLAQVLLCWRRDAFSRQTVRRIYTALRPPRDVARTLARTPPAMRPIPRRIEPRTDDVWALCGPLAYGGETYARVVEAVPAGQRGRLVAIDPRQGDHGQVVSLVVPPVAPVALDDDADDDEEELRGAA
jgi:hypothetical protein